MRAKYHVKNNTKTRNWETNHTRKRSMPGLYDPLQNVVIHPANLTWKLIPENTFTNIEVGFRGIPQEQWSRPWSHAWQTKKLSKITFDYHDLPTSKPPNVPNQNRTSKGGQTELLQGSMFVKKMWKSRKIIERTSITWKFLSPPFEKSGSLMFWTVLFWVVGIQ